MMIYIGNTATAVYLNGGMMASPYRGAHWAQDPLGGDKREKYGLDSLVVELQGTPVVISEAVSRLEGLLATADQGEAAYLPLYLMVQAHESEPVYRARIRQGWLKGVKPSAAQRQSGTQTLQVALLRERYFEGPETEIGLTNTFGSGVTGGLDVYNTCDNFEPVLNQKRVNYVQLPNNLAGAVPSPLKLQYQLRAGSAWGPLRLFISQYVAGYGAVDYRGVIEVETSAPGTTVPGAADFTLYSEGFGKRYTLSTTWAVVSSWSLSAAVLEQLAGRFTHVVGSFQGNVVSDSLFLRLEVLFGSVVIYTAAPVRCTAEGYQDLGTLPLPPLPTLGAGAQALTLRLMGRRSNTGLTLTMDALYLMPADAFRILNSSIAPAANEAIMDNGLENELYLQRTSGRLNCLSAVGSVGLAIPGMVSRVSFVAMNGNGVDPRINGRVRAWYRPRKEVL